MGERPGIVHYASSLAYRPAGLFFHSPPDSDHTAETSRTRKEDRNGETSESNSEIKLRGVHTAQALVKPPRKPGLVKLHPHR